MVQYGVMRHGAQPYIAAIAGSAKPGTRSFVPANSTSGKRLEALRMPDRRLRDARAESSSARAPASGNGTMRAHRRRVSRRRAPGPRRSPRPEPLPEASAPHRVTVERAVTKCSSPSCKKRPRRHAQEISAFDDQAQGVLDRPRLRHDRPVGADDVRQFRTSWPVNPQTGVRRMAMMKPFFEYCVSNKWIKENPARGIKNPKGRDMSDRANEQKLPFTDDEIKKMYEACQEYGRTDRHKWNGEDVADFISLSIYTGLRISDVALFQIDRMLPSGEIRVRTTKAGTHVYTWVPQWLQDRIRERAQKHGTHIFGAHTTQSLDVITELWRRKLKIVWEACGPWKVKPTPHRFRHTFARILLQKPGVTVRDVAELLGNTEDVVRRAYSAWVPERQARLTKILQEAFDNKPKPKLVAMPRGRG